MSENLDLVRSIFAAWERGDFSSADWAHPDHVYEIVGGPAPGQWKGLPAMKQAWREILSAWEDWRTVADSYQELDAGRVVVFSHSTARGKTSGIGIPSEWTKGAVIFDIRDGKVLKHTVYLGGRAQALADLGLEV